MGQRRESLVLSDEEKERVAYHEGGHAVLAYVLEHADPVHKVTILPTGMALGVTQQLPMEERHIYPRDHIEDSLCVRMGGRVAELLVYGDLSTGAANDLVGNTEMARKMVREWGMSEEIGPMAWGSQGQVFLGEDLMHTRDYSEDTSRVIDDEVERILRAQEERAIEVLTRHKGGLDGVAAALLSQETIDGHEVGRLVDEAYGRPVHLTGAKAVPQFNGAGGAHNGASSNGANGAHTPNGSVGATSNGRPAAHGDPAPQPASSQPASSQPASSQPASSQPASSQPAGSPPAGSSSDTPPSAVPAGPAPAAVPSPGAWAPPTWPTPPGSPGGSTARPDAPEGWAPPQWPPPPAAPGNGDHH